MANDRKMKNWDVILLTQNSYVNPHNPDAYVQNILLEDQLLQSALENEGLRVCRKAWDDPNFDWSRARALLFRATWDYFDRIEEFQQWFEKVRNRVPLINPAELIEWNLDKHYLLDLQDKGIPLPPTLLLEKGSPKSLSEQYKDLLKLGLKEKACVLKPCISGGARHTYLIKEDEIHKYESIYQELIEKESLLLQEFQRNVPIEGERSYMIFGNEYSHAVLKKAKSGDFRVQDDFGGSLHPCQPSPEEKKLALQVVKACPAEALYARVDLFKDNYNQWSLAEIELIEPELWFRMDQHSSTHLARTVNQYLNEKAT